MSNGRSFDPAFMAVGLILFAMAGILAWDLASLRLSTTYGLGPKAMPAVIAVGLAILGVANIVNALRERPERESVDPMPIVLILGGLAVLIASIGLGGGFIVATGLMFALTARAFGRRAFAVDVGIGIVLGLVIYFLFAKLLSLSLPQGPLERLI